MPRHGNKQITANPGKPRANGFRQKHTLGQNFILDEAFQEELAAASGVLPDEGVLEIGPGLGGLTKALAARGARVIALELDERLIPILRVSMEKYPNVTVAQGDALRVDLAALTAPLGAFHVVANLPYHITTPFLTMLLSSDLPLVSIHVMLQKEAADKLVAAPGTPEYGPLALRAQWRAQPRIALSVPAARFTPPPKVDSAFVSMPMRKAPPVAVRDEKLMFRVISAAFALRRKTLLNNLMPAFQLSREDAAAWLEGAGIAPDARGETLDIAAFARLADWYLDRFI